MGYLKWDYDAPAIGKVLIKSGGGVAGSDITDNVSGSPLSISGGDSLSVMSLGSMTYSNTGLDFRVWMDQTKNDPDKFTIQYDDSDSGNEVGFEWDMINKYVAIDQVFKVTQNKNTDSVVKFKNESTYNGSTSGKRVLDLTVGGPSFYGYTDYINFYLGTTKEGRIGVYNSTLGILQNSDETLKKNIKKTKEDSLGKLNSLEVVNYEWRDESKGLEHIGIIAQQALNVIPEMVIEGGEDETMQVMFEKLHPHYIKAIQQLAEKIEKLEKELLKRKK